MAEESSEQHGGTGNTITAHQLEQLLKLLPTPSKPGGAETDDDMDMNYSGMMVSCNNVIGAKDVWIVDSGASHHMTGNQQIVKNLHQGNHRTRINLPNGETSVIEGVGEVYLQNGMTLKNVLYIPTFKHNLLSVQKLNRQEQCKVTFMSHFCIIQDNDTGIVKGVGRSDNGLYYLLNESLNEQLEKIKRMTEGQCEIMK
ncbi:Retrovirus-related Pol polyprotein from transposon TNT 1-94 [Bienertia sinuspersici]